MVKVCLHDDESVTFGITLYCCGLVGKGVLLVLGGHSNVLNGGNDLGSHDGALLERTIGKAFKNFRGNASARLWATPAESSS